jgi:type IV pilus assembly protein PilP
MKPATMAGTCRQPLRLALALAAIAALLAGCGGGDRVDLTEWMAQQKREVRPGVSPLQPPKRFEPEAYTAIALTDPFSVQKLAGAQRQEARQASSVLAAELNRRKEPLEEFPLDSMAMVGSLSRQGRPHALLRVNNLLYQVAVGDHVGQNFGRILAITETEIRLREIVQDAAGEWIERPVTLHLQQGPR